LDKIAKDPVTPHFPISEATVTITVKQITNAIFMQRYYYSNWVQ